MADGAHIGRFTTRIQRPLSKAVLDGYSKRRWQMKHGAINLPKDCAPAVRYESGSTMVVECSWGPVTIRPRK